MLTRKSLVYQVKEKHSSQSILVWGLDATRYSWLPRNAPSRDTCKTIRVSPSTARRRNLSTASRQPFLNRRFCRASPWSPYCTLWSVEPVLFPEVSACQQYTLLCICLNSVVLRFDLPFLRKRKERHRAGGYQRCLYATGLIEAVPFAHKMQLCGEPIRNERPSVSPEHGLFFTLYLILLMWLHFFIVIFKNVLTDIARTKNKAKGRKRLIETIVLKLDWKLDAVTLSRDRRPNIKKRKQKHVLFTPAEEKVAKNSSSHPIC